MTLLISGDTGITLPDGTKLPDDLGDAAFANIVGTMAAGDIIESGINGNGEYVKFADGTLIVTRSVVVTLAIEVPNGTGIFRSSGSASGNFAATFINTPSVTYSVLPNPNERYLWAGPITLTTTTFGARVMCGISLGSTLIDVRVLAIGRWK